MPTPSTPFNFPRMADTPRFPVELPAAQSVLQDWLISFSHTLAEDPRFHFRVVVTRDWKAIDLSPRIPSVEQPLATVGLLRRVNAPEADLEVACAQLPREMDSADWLELYLERSKHEILTGRRMPTRSGDAADVLSRAAGENGFFIFRTLTIKDGPFIFLLQGRVAESVYNRVADEFLLAVQTFALANPTGEPYSEPMDTYEVTMPMPAQFLFPASWEFKEDPHPLPGGTTFSLLNRRGDQCMGQFTFAAIPAEAEADHHGVLKTYVGELHNNGVQVPAPKIEPQEHPESFEGLWGGACIAEKDGQPLDIRCCVARHPDGWLLFGLVGPNRGADAEANVINVRAFRLALETLRLT